MFQGSTLRPVALDGQGPELIGVIAWSCWFSRSICLLIWFCLGLSWLLLDPLEKGSELAGVSLLAIQLGEPRAKRLII